MTTLPAKADDFEVAIQDLDKVRKMTQQLMQTPHYAKMGEIGVFTIVQKARTVGLNPLDALNGAMYFVNGKVELAANTMNYMIRAKGHSITKDPKSDKSVCILHGKRADNGDTWSCSFSIEDAKKAGIYKNVFERYTEDMLFNRALTRLARQLFPDVIKGCYVEGEISAAIPQDFKYSETIEMQPEVIAKEQAEELLEILKDCSLVHQTNFNNFLTRNKIASVFELTPEMYQKLRILAVQRREESQKLLESAITPENSIVIGEVANV